ncbi:MAG: hypothetical protein ACO29Q_10980, partial [Crocinitomicaceae bacterium]
SMTVPKHNPKLSSMRNFYKKYFLSFIIKIRLLPISQQASRFLFLSAALLHYTQGHYTKSAKLLGISSNTLMYPTFRTYKK